MLRISLACFVAVLLPVMAAPEAADAIAREILSPLLDPAKVATLKGDRPANARLYRVIYWLETARRAGGQVPALIDIAQAAGDYAGTKGAAADKEAITWGHQKLAGFECFTPAGMKKLRKGGSPQITAGQHAGDFIALDHVLARAVVPELAARFYNLEAIPARLNFAKAAKITQREVLLARRWNRDGLLSAEGLVAVEKAAAMTAP